MKTVYDSTPPRRRVRPQQREGHLDDKNSFFQPKLNIGKPNDQYEREADAVAEKVVSSQNNMQPVQRMTISSIQRIATSDEDKISSTFEGKMAVDKKIQRKSEDSQRHKGGSEGLLQKMNTTKDEENPMQKMEADKEEENALQKTSKENESVQTKEKESVQAKSEAAPQQVFPSFSSRLSTRKGTGHPLSAVALKQMEQGIGADFSKVRIHTDPEAVQMTKEVHAQAFTHGSDVYFNTGKFNPEDKSGKKLLAHELTHVVQQNSNISRKSAVTQSASNKIQRAWYSFVGDAADWVGAKVKSGAQSTWSGVKYVGGKVSDAAKWTSGKVVSGAKSAWAGIKSLGRQIGRGASWIGGKVLSGIKSLWNGAKWMAGKVGAGLGWVYNKVKKGAKHLIKRAWLSFFSHYMPRMLLNHYMDGSGNPITLTQQQMKDCNPQVDIRRSKTIMDEVRLLQKKGGGTKHVSKATGWGGALTNGTLGNFTIYYSGMLTVKPSGDWGLNGSLSFYDIYDFDPKPFGKSGRSTAGEIKTRVGAYLIPGKPFSVLSEEVAVSQNNSLNNALWGGGFTPVFVNDKGGRAATDIGAGDIAGGPEGAETGAQGAEDLN